MLPDQSLIMALMIDLQILQMIFYNNIRHDMLTAISRFCNPGLDVLLYGNPTLSNETNIIIFTTILTFRLGTKPFC